MSYWSVLFNANSFSDLLDQINAISEVMDYDNQVMDNLVAARQAVADAKADLEENKVAEEAAKADLESQKAELETEQANVDAVISEIESQSSVYAQKMDELEDDSATIASQIAQAEKDYQARLEAQRKAEEAKKAQEEASKGQSSSSNSGKDEHPQRWRQCQLQRVPVAAVRVHPGLVSLSVTGTAPSTGRSSTAVVTCPLPAERPSWPPRAA